MKRDHRFLYAALVQFALFLPMMRWAQKHPSPSGREIRISRQIQRKHPLFLRLPVLVVNSIVGSAVAVNLLALPITVVLWKRHFRLEAVMTLGMCWVSELIRQIIKKIVNRPRPSALLVHVTTHPQGKSFPSGDVASSVCLWGWLLALGWQTRQKHQGRQRIWLSLPALWLLLVGPARIYLGAHWPGDVLGGYLFGGGWLSLTLHFYHRWHGTSKIASDERNFPCSAETSPKSYR